MIREPHHERGVDTTVQVFSRSPGARSKSDG
jgi:hypothetical protein